VRTQRRIAAKTRELALFNLAIDNKPRGCDLVSLRVRDVAQGDLVLRRAKPAPRALAYFVASVSIG